MARDCAEDCRHRGIVASGEQRLTDVQPTQLVMYEAHYHGCSPCIVDRGAGAGAPCSTAKICQSECYQCLSGRSSVSLRACLDGHCARGKDLQALLGRLDALGSCVGSSR